MSFNVSQRPHSEGKIVKQKDKSKESALKILPPENGQFDREDTWESTGSGPSSGRKSSSGKRAPPVQKSDSYTPRRTPTPSKQVNLQVARRKESSEDASFGDLNWKEHERLESARLQNSGAKPKKPSHHSNANKGTKTRDQNHTGVNGQSTSGRHPRQHNCDTSKQKRETSDLGDKTAEQMLKQCYKKEDVSDLMEDMGFAESASASSLETSAGRKEDGKNNQKHTKKGLTQKENGKANFEDSDEFDTDLENGEESSSDSEDEEEEKRKAPDELKMEFLGAVMRHAWPEAQKLCQMILIYEPEHEEANSFKDLIAEKVQLEAELAEESGSDYESGDEDDDEEGDSSDDSDADSDEEDESSDSDDEDTSTDQNQGASGHSDNLDSGIASTTDVHERY